MTLYCGSRALICLFIITVLVFFGLSSSNIRNRKHGGTCRNNEFVVVMDSFIDEPLDVRFINAAENGSKFIVVTIDELRSIARELKSAQQSVDNCLKSPPHRTTKSFLLEDRKEGDYFRLSWLRNFALLLLFVFSFLGMCHGVFQKHFLPRVFDSERWTDMQSRCTDMQSRCTDMQSRCTDMQSRCTDMQSKS